MPSRSQEASASALPSPAPWCGGRRLLLMDEPLSNLDAKVRHTAREELKLFQRDIHVTTIYVTHDQAEAMGLGDRIAVMHEGRSGRSARPTPSTTIRPTCS